MLHLLHCPAYNNVSAKNMFALNTLAAFFLFRIIVMLQCPKICFKKPMRQFS